MSRKVMAAILAHREVAPLLSDEHFSVDGTLIKAWASMKSFQQKAEATPPDDEGPGDPPAPDTTLEPAPSQTPAETDPMPRNSRRHRNAEVDFKGEKRSNTTHASTTDPDARLYKKSPGTGAMLCFIGHALMENRNGLVVQGDLTQADGHAERKAALDMIHRHSPGSTRRLTLGADKGYDASGFVTALRQAWRRYLDSLPQDDEPPPVSDAAILREMHPPHPAEVQQAFTDLAALVTAHLPLDVADKAAANLVRRLRPGVTPLAALSRQHEPSTF